MSECTLDDYVVNKATVTIPRSGVLYADVELPGDVRFEAFSKHILRVADLSIACAVVSGGVEGGSAKYRLAGGAGKWGAVIRARSYSNDAGVKVSKIIADIAKDCGEQVDSAPQRGKVGNYYVRAEAPASCFLNWYFSGKWHVGYDGITRLAPWPSSKVESRPLSYDPQHKTATYALENLAEIHPGCDVSGLFEAADIVHKLDGIELRTVFMGVSVTDMFAKLLYQHMPELRYRGVWSYRVVSKQGNRYNLQPELQSSGMPDLLRVPVRAGVAGYKGELRSGSMVLVTFINCNATRPVIVGFDDPDSAGFLPQNIDFGVGCDVRIGGSALQTDATSSVLRYGDGVDMTSLIPLLSGVFLEKPVPVPPPVPHWQLMPSPTQQLVGVSRLKA